MSFIPNLVQCSGLCDKWGAIEDEIYVQMIVWGLSVRLISRATTDNPCPRRWMVKIVFNEMEIKMITCERDDEMSGFDHTHRPSYLFTHGGTRCVICVMDINEK